MIQIRCDKCEKEFAITKDKCPFCGDEVKTSCKFYCGKCEGKMKIKEGKCTKCGCVPKEIIVEDSEGNRTRTEFSTADSNIEETIEETPKELEADETSKIQRILKNDMLLLACIQIIGIIVFLIVDGTFNFFSVAFAILLFLGYKQVANGSKNAGIIGIVVACLMMLTIISFDILDFALGLFLMIHSVKYNKLFNN